VPLVSKGTFILLYNSGEQGVTNELVKRVQTEIEGKKDERAD
jgi:hypothetical protein